MNFFYHQGFQGVLLIALFGFLNQGCDETMFLCLVSLQVMLVPKDVITFVTFELSLSITVILNVGITPQFCFKSECTAWEITGIGASYVMDLLVFQ